MNQTSTSPADQRQDAKESSNVGDTHAQTRSDSASNRNQQSGQPRDSSRWGPRSHSPSARPRRHSPRRHSRSRSPRRGSNSPRRHQRSRSPRRDSRPRSPQRYSRSPARSVFQPRSRSRSPPRSPPRGSFRDRGQNNPGDRDNRNDFRRRGGGAGPGPRSGPNKGQRGPKHESTFRAGGPAGSAKETWGRPEAEEEDKKPVIPEEEKEKPNFGLSGALAAETNKSANGTLLKYNEPAEARKPSQRWRLYVFKGDKEVDLLHIHRQSAFLFGRDRNVVDIPLDHPSCSKQHAVLQFRQVVENDALGQPKRSTKPFIIDLESANGTFVNGSQIPSTRYYELKVSDMIKFGASSREFVLLHESA